MLTMMQTTSRKVKGISLLEVMLSLSIIAIILVMATRYFMVASENQKVNTAKRAVGAIVAALHSYQAGADYATNEFTKINSLQTLIDDGYMQNLFTTTSKNPWGATFNLAAQGNTFVLISTVVPKGACDALAGAHPNLGGGHPLSGTNPQCTAGSDSRHYTFNYCFGGIISGGGCIAG